MPKLAVIIPTFNESGNVPVLISRLHGIFSGAGIDWEAIFVDDDSPDGTSQILRDIASRDARVRLLHRVGRRGLASACVEGMLSTSAPFIAVMDSDLQHDEAVLPAMLRKLEHDSLDVVVATRHDAGGSMGEFSARRVHLSNLGKKLASIVCHADVTDPMSGFFALRSSYLHEVVHHLSQSGFKILVDLLASARRPVALGEVPYTFRSRLSGESKLDSSVLISYLYLLADQMFGRWLPLRFVLFCLVGGGGVLLHLLCLYAGLQIGFSFNTALITATVVAMTANYIVNNAFTFLDRKRKGARWFTGLLLWYVACSVGVFLNLRVADTLHDHNLGWLLSGLAGLTVAAVWNFAVTNVMIWRSKMKRANERARLHLTRAAHA